MTHATRSDRDLATLLCALSFATGVGFGGHLEHGLRSAYLGLQIADGLALPAQDREAVFYGALLKDVACTACSAGIAAFFPDDEQVSLSDVILVDPSKISDMLGWLSRYLPLDSRLPGRIAKLLAFMAQCGTIVRETMRGHCEVAALFARQLGFPEYVELALRFQWERWDGRGMAYKLKGPSIPMAARILHISQVLELTHGFGGPQAACANIQEKRGTRFDPAVVDVFLAQAQQADFWNTFEVQSTQEALLASCPSTEADRPWEDQTRRVCEALADFVDSKSRETWHHSRRVAEIAVNIGTCLELEPQDLTRLRYAALVHDVGKVVVPVPILTKGEQRSSSEWETYRLHPYYTQRILERVASLQDLAQPAAAHHEWINGQGFHRQLSGEQIPLHGRILAVSNVYARLLQQQDSAQALHDMRSLVGTQFDASCYDALVASVNGGADPRTAPSTPQRVGNLTRRECEVLRLLAQGQNVPQIGRTLSISKKTVEHHVAHIYNKAGISCRTAAAIYALQQGLV